MKSVRKNSSIHEFRDQFRISYLKTNIFFLVQQKNCSMFAVVSCNEFPQLCGASRDTRCPETAGVLSLRLPASGPATGRPAVRLCPPKAPRPKRPKAKKAWRPSKCPGDLISRCKGPTSCPLRRSGGWTRRRGRSGSSKRFVSQNPIQHHWHPHSSKQRLKEGFPLEHVTRKKRDRLWWSRDTCCCLFFAKPLSFSQDSSKTMSALYAIFVYGKAFQLFIRYSTSVTPVIHDHFFSIIAIEDDEISNQCQASHLRSLLQYIYYSILQYIYMKLGSILYHAMPCNIIYLWTPKREWKIQGHWLTNI